MSLLKPLSFPDYDKESRLIGDLYSAQADDPSEDEMLRLYRIVSKGLERWSMYFEHVVFSMLDVKPWLDVLLTLNNKINQSGFKHVYLPQIKWFFVHFAQLTRTYRLQLNSCAQDLLPSKSSKALSDDFIQQNSKRLITLIDSEKTFSDALQQLCIDDKAIKMEAR